jgi:hypothetical protein
MLWAATLRSLSPEEADVDRTYERYLKDEDFRRALLERARHEQARAIVRVLRGLFRGKPSVEKGRAARPHLARQG